MGVISNGTTLLDAGAIDSGIATGAMTLIKTLTASTSATLSFVDGASSVVFDDTYDSYVFKFYNIHPANDGVAFLFNLSVDTGSNYNVTKTTTLFRSIHLEDDSQTSFGYRAGEDLAQSTAFQHLHTNSGNDNDQHMSGELTVYDPSNTTFIKHFLSRFQSAAEGDWSQEFHMRGYGNTTSAVDAVQFKFVNGNIDSGTIKMYGIK